MSSPYQSPLCPLSPCPCLSCTVAAGYKQAMPQVQLFPGCLRFTRILNGTAMFRRAADSYRNDSPCLSHQEGSAGPCLCLLAQMEQASPLEKGIWRLPLPERPQAGGFNPFCFASGEWPSSGLPERAGPCLPAAHPCCPPRSPPPATSQHPTARQGTASLRSPPRAATRPAGVTALLPDPSFHSVPANPHQNGTGVRCDPATPGHSTPLRGVRAQPLSQLPGSRQVFPQGTGSSSVTPKSPSGDSLAMAPLPRCGPVAGERADGGRFRLRRVTQA